jgi:hypothetical protein
MPVSNFYAIQRHIRARRDFLMIDEEVWIISDLPNWMKIKSSEIQ